MKNTKLVCLLCAAALTLGLAACGVQAPAETPGPSPTQSGSGDASQLSPEAVPFALPFFPGASLHPVRCADRTNLTLIPLMYEGLFALDTAFEPQSVLCESWTADESGLVWTFTLREGVLFSDGTPLTAAHAVSSLRAAVKEDSRYAARLAQVASVTAKGELELTITLRTPNGALPTLLDIPIFLESEGRCLGTGPYVMDEDRQSALAANPLWWQGRDLPADRIPLTPVDQAGDLINAFDSRQAGLVVTDLTGTAVPGYSSSYEVWDCPTSTMLCLLFNTRTGRCNDPDLRRALALGVDRASLTNSIFARRVTPAQLPVSPASALYDESVGRTLDYSVAGMNELLRQFRRLPSLRVVVNGENTFKVNAAEFLAEQWRGAGLEVTVETPAWEDYLAVLESGDFDLCLAEVSLTPDFDLTALLGQGGTLNYGGWADPETDALLAAFRAAGEDREEAAHALYAHLAEQVPLVPLCFKNHSVLVQWQQITGLTPTQADPFYGLDWALTQ